MYPKKMYMTQCMRPIKSSGMGNCLLLRAQGEGTDHQEREKLQIPRGGGDMVTG